MQRVKKLRGLKGLSLIHYNIRVKGSQNPLLQKLDSAINRDSDSCTESPPSYGQLNFIDKITRYFDSNLLINRPYGSDEDNVNPSMPSNKNDSKPISNSTGKFSSLYQFTQVSTFLCWLFSCPVGSH